MSNLMSSDPIMEQRETTAFLRQTEVPALVLFARSNERSINETERTERNEKRRTYAMMKAVHPFCFLFGSSLSPPFPFPPSPSQLPSHFCRLQRESKQVVSKQTTHRWIRDSCKVPISKERSAYRKVQWWIWADRWAYLRVFTISGTSSLLRVQKSPALWGISSKETLRQDGGNGKDRKNKLSRTRVHSDLKGPGMTQSRCFLHVCPVCACTRVVKACKLPHSSPGYGLLPNILLLLLLHQLSFHDAETMAAWLSRR